MSTEANEVTNQSQELNETVETAPNAASDAEALTFDDLDNLVDGRSDKELISEAKKEAKKPAKKNESQDEGLGKDEATEAKKEAELANKEEITKSEQEEVKKILGRSGKKDLELNPETTFKHKVDGEDIDVSLQDLLNNYSGKVSYDKKFQEFSETRKEFENNKRQYDGEISNINQYINNFAEKLRDEDAMGALEYFASFAGVKPYEFRTELLRQLAPEVERRSMMSSDEIENENLRAQNEYLRAQQESEVRYKETEQSQVELSNDIKRIQEAHNITDEDFEKAYYELVESNYDGDINPALVGEYYVHTQAFSQAENVLNQVDTNLTSNDQIVESLQKVIVENPSFDNDDLLDIVKEVYSDYKEETSKTVSKKLAVSDKPQKKSRDKEDFLSFEDF
jgi:hypothetical protein